MREPGTRCDAWAARRRATVSTVSIIIIAAALASPIEGQDTGVGRPSSATPVADRDTARGGPAFFMMTPDGARIDARDEAILQRRLSLTLIGVPLGTAVEAIGDRTGLAVAFSTELIPVGARISMKADDVTVARALTWALAEARLDVLLEPDGQLTLVPQPPSRGEPDSSGVLTGTLVDADNMQPVPYATVTLLGTDRTRFVDAQGRFRMARLTSRSYRVRARQIGYVPMDTTVAVQPAPRVATIVLRMHRVPALLRLVQVRGRHVKGCVATGVSDATANPTLVAVFAQVHENVDRYQLLLHNYPFRYTREERLVLQRTPGGDSIEHVDTVSYDSRAYRAYQEGGIIFSRRDTLRRRTDVSLECQLARAAGKSCGVDDSTTLRLKWAQASRGYVAGVYEDGLKYRMGRYMYLPTFRDLADSTFLAAHCFSYGGVIREKRGPALLRVDFEPAGRIRTPDVEGSVYLDAQRLVVRRAVFTMTKPGAAFPPILGLTATTTFRELVPLVPIIDSVESEQPLPVVPAVRPALGLGIAPPTHASVTRLAIGTAHVLDVAFETETPGDQSPLTRSATGTATRHPDCDSAAPRFHFEAALIPGCAVPQFVRQRFDYNLRNQ